jgi:predicted DCC family thiol-disulfide oxidoreductase YuxK
MTSPRSAKGPSSIALMGRAVLLYDQDCGFCRWATSRLLAWDRRGGVSAIAIQSDEGEALLRDVAPGRRLASWHLVTGDGVFSAGAAIEPLARRLPFGRPIAGVASAFPRATERAYEVLARNRGTLGRLIGARACDVDPSDPR